MKKFTIFLQLVCVIVFFSCEKDEERAIINEEDAAPPTLISPTNFYEKVIEEQDLDELITFVWEPVRYGLNTPVTYTLAIDSANREFSGKKILGSSMTNTLTMTIGELNDVLVDDLEITPNEAATIELKVTSRLANSDRTLESDPITLIVTPWKDESEEVEPDYIWIAGGFQAWNVGAGLKIAAVKNDGIYEGYFYIPESADPNTYQFKLYAQPDWGPLSYGAADGGMDENGVGELIVYNDAGYNFAAPSGGYYFFGLDLNTMTYRLIKITKWGLIGGATPGGWDADTDMTFDPAEEVWTVTTDMKANDAFKFRANGEWVLDLGIDENGKLRYENNPFLEYIEGARPTVPEDGNYTITLDLSEAGNYTYKAEKN